MGDLGGGRGDPRLHALRAYRRHRTRRDGDERGQAGACAVGIQSGVGARQLLPRDHPPVHRARRLADGRPASARKRDRLLRRALRHVRCRADPARTAARGGADHPQCRLRAGLRNDRDDRHDQRLAAGGSHAGRQPAHAQCGQGRTGRGDDDRRRGRRGIATRRNRRIADQIAQQHAGILGQTRCDCRGAERRLDAHRRCRLHGR